MPFTDKFAPYSFPTLGYIRIPKLEIPDDDRERLSLAKNATSEKYLSELIKEGLTAKVKAGLIKESDISKYKERANMEFLEIKRLLFTDYILLVYRVIKFCKDNDILNGPARGSCGGSCLLYLLGVIQIDPIKYDLLFERFISSARTEVKEIGGDIYIKSDSLPDVDIDSEGLKKELINGYLETLFPKRTAAILNISFHKGKISIKECLKVMLGFSEDESKRVSSMVETKFGKVDSIVDSLEENEEFKNWVAESPKHQKVADTACIINCLVKNTSVHASGVILCENELTDTLPCQLTADKEIVSSYDMRYCGLLGIKIDNLGVKNLDAIEPILKEKGITWENFNPDDPSIYEFINRSGAFYGIFQAKDGLGKDTLKKIKPHCLEDISLSIALGRPGSMRYIKDYVDFKEGRKIIDENYPNKVKEILAPTAYSVIFQEQVMKLAQVMASFTPLETNNVRRCIGKKKKEQMLEYKSKFIDGCARNGYEKEFAEKIWQSFEDSGDYSFNKCLSPETMVQTKVGYKPMCEIEIGDEILAFNKKNMSDEFVTVVNKIENRAELYEITLEDGRKIQASLNHKFMVEGGEMLPLSEILQKQLKIMTD